MDKIELDILSMGYREKAAGIYMKPVAFALLTIEVKEEITITLWFKSSMWEDPDNDLCKNGMCIWSSEKLEQEELITQIKTFEWEHLFQTGVWDSEFNFL